MDKLLLEKLNQIKDKYELIQKELYDPNINTKELITKQKELAKLEDIYVAFNEYLKLAKEASGLEEIIESETDKEIIQMSKDELSLIAPKLEHLIGDLKYLLIPKDENDTKNIIVEIKGAVGGSEANLFAGDLYRMYQRYAEKYNYKVELIEASTNDDGGFSRIEFMIKGKSAYSRFKYESGVHRVQRVPLTETMGRVHTSTATVYVMPEADEIDIAIDPKDIKIDAFYSNGAGGQSVNTTMSAVRITHLPTGIVVTCQNERSQIQNKEKAMASLRARLYEQKMQEAQEKAGALKKSSVGAGMRSEKIRTYNYPQNRVTDHRYNITKNNLDEIINGNLDIILEPLLEKVKADELLNNAI